MSKEWRDFLTDKEIMKAEKIKDRIENEIWMRIVEEGEDSSIFAGDIVFKELRILTPNGFWM